MDWFVRPCLQGGDLDALRRARLVASFAIALILLAILYATILLWTGSVIGAAALAAAIAVCLLTLYLMRRTGSSLVAGNLLTAAFLGVLTVIACRLGGQGSLTLPWYAAVPIVALSTAGRRSAVIWLTVTVSFLAAFYALDYVGYAFPNDLAPRPYKLVCVLAWIGLIGLMMTLARLYESFKDETLAELRKVEKRLREEKGFLDSTIASLPGIFYLFDDQGKFLRWNENFERVSGYSPEELSKMQPLDFACDQDRQLISRRLQELFAEGQSSSEAGLVTKHGSTVPYFLTGKRVTLDQRQYLVGVGLDMTERQRAEQAIREQTALLQAKNAELERQQAQLKAQQHELLMLNRDLEEATLAAEAAARSKSEFLANMSHEIRTPMTAILGFTDVLLEHGDLEHAPPERIEAARTIKRNGEHLLCIINDILDLSKIDAGRMTVEKIACSPCRIIAEVASLVGVPASAKGLPLHFEYLGPIPETIQTDPTRLRQILVNLIGNAIKFTEVGEVRLVTSFVDQGAGPLLQFDVVDTGVGMSEAQGSRVFAPFTQADASTTRKFGGTGLGLTISKRLAQMLGGEITVVESQEGIGTRFRLTMATGPLDGVRMIYDPASAATVATEAAQTNESAAPADLAECRVLLAEDGPDNQRLIAHVLQKAGAVVTIKENGELAVDVALSARDGANPFDVILMDMQMPVMDGYQATRLLRQKGYTGPIIALTAHTMEGDRVKCLRAGCDDYAAKPIDRRRLIATIRKCLRPAGTW